MHYTKHSMYVHFYFSMLLFTLGALQFSMLGCIFQL